MSQALIDEFNGGMMENLTEARYNSTRVLQMMHEHGGLETAQILLATDHESEGYTAMWEGGRLDLTVEALVLEPRFRPLFSDQERLTAQCRLERYEFIVQQ